VPSDSPAGLLRHADELAWNNNWLRAVPIYARAEQGFRKQGDAGHALYAHVSQVPPKMENSDLSQLIADLTADLKLPEASRSNVRLRILEMKAKCEEEYDADISRKTFAEVEQLAIRQGKPFLASRASGEQGILAFTLGDIAEASSRVKQAYAVAKYLGDPAAHVRYAEMIGFGLSHLGRPKQAMRFLDEAISTQRNHPEVATPVIAYNGKIDALSQLGQNKDAIALADQVIDIPRNRHMYGELQALLTSRSEVLSKLGKPNEAIAGYEEALGYARTLKAWRAISYTDAKLAAALEQTNQLSRALAAIDEAIAANQQNPQEMVLVPENLAIKARIRKKMGYLGEAENLYKQGASILDIMLAHVPTAETERLLLTELSDLYSGYFELLSNEGRFDEAFQVIEEAHGRIEAQDLEFDHTVIPHPLTADEGQLHALEVAFLKSEPNGDKGKFLQVMKSAEISSGNAPRERTATLTQLQSRLKPNELFIEYVLAAPHSYALAITSSTVKQHILPPKDQIEAEASKYRDALSKQKTDPKLGSEIFNHILNFLGEYPQAASLIVVPDGGLHLLPLSALITANGKYLFEVEPTSIAPSGTVLWLLRGRSPEPAGTLPYLGVAAFTMPSDPRPWIVRAASPQSTELVPLPESRNEVESIGAMMPQPSTILLGSGATKKKFQDLPLGNYRVLHLALHGFVDPVFPDKSAIVFAPSGGDNGRLEARDIRQLHLHADLVTLSACDTAVGPVGTSGVESVVAAFVQAGASSVVATLWELEDHASNKFMKAFYTHLQTVGKAEALRQAKLDLLHIGLPPYYWASYEIVGDSQGPLFPPK
jgi:CHAT domain-containing protein